VQARADVTMIRDNHDGKFLRIPAYFYTTTRIVNRAQEFDIDSVLAELNFKVQQFNRRGSGFELERIVRSVLVINTYRPLHGSTYLPTPDWLERKRCIVNVNNKDQRCFLWSILAALFPASSNISRLGHYINHQSAVDITGLDYPVLTKQIPHFENNNPEISINVLTVDEDAKSFCVEYLSPHRARTHHIIFLLLEDPSNPAKRHYTYVKNMSALVSHRTKRDGKTYVCNSCLHPFKKEETLDRHIPFCVKHDAQQVVYPNADDENDCTLQFKSVQKQHPVPFYIVADFESFLAPIDRAETDDSNGLTIIDEHVVSGFCTYRVTHHAEHQTPAFVYSGPDPVTKFYAGSTRNQSNSSRLCRHNSSDRAAGIRLRTGCDVWKLRLSFHKGQQTKSSPRPHKW